VTSGEAARSIVVCGTGVGASIAANKMRASAPQSATTFIRRIKAWSMTMSTSCNDIWRDYSERAPGPPAPDRDPDHSFRLSLPPTAFPLPVKRIATLALRRL
jgi:hypothetical protein